MHMGKTVNFEDIDDLPSMVLSHSRHTRAYKLRSHQKQVQGIVMQKGIASTGYIHPLGMYNIHTVTERMLVSKQLKVDTEIS